MRPTDPRCPWCGASVDFVTPSTGGAVRRPMMHQGGAIVPETRPESFYACMRCEWCGFEPGAAGDPLRCASCDQEPATWAGHTRGFVCACPDPEDATPPDPDPDPPRVRDRAYR